MKKYIHIVTIVLGLQLLTACTSILEVKPQSAITEEVYFTNEGDFEPYLVGIYSLMRSISTNVTYGTERGEELIAASNSRFGVAWSQIITPTSGAINYNSWYVAIGHCNLLLKKIEGFSFASDPDTRKRILAETYALRAFFYFNLARIIGDAPLMLDAVVDENVPLLSRASSAEVFKQINADLDQAISLLKTMGSFSAKSYPSKYRFAYGSVLALKADAKVWSAKVLNSGNQDYQEAVSIITEIETTGLSLNTDFKNVMGVRASGNSEVALAAYYSRDETGGNYGVNALPFLAIIQGALNLDSIPYTQTAATGQGAYQISTISRGLFNNTNDKRIPYTWVVERQSTGPKIAWITKYAGTKYSDDRISDNDIVLYRLADLYLLKAEALAASGNLTESVSYLNRVRTRAGLSPYEVTGKQQLEREILDERGRELFFENKRWYDLVRFHKGGTLDIYQYIPNLKGKTTPLFWPLNTTVLGNNNLIKQTEGY